MDSIRKKMQSLKYETDELYRNIQDNEDVTKEANERSDKCECDIRDTSKKIAKMESDFEETSEKLLKASADLEEKKKQHQELFMNHVITQNSIQINSNPKILVDNHFSS